MEELEQGQEVLREDVDLIKRKIDQILEKLQVLERKEVHLKPIASAESVTPSHPLGFTSEPQQFQAENFQFPIYDLPQAILHLWKMSLTMVHSILVQCRFQ